MEKIILRIDDIGASTKIYNQHGKVYWPVFNKKLPIAFFANWFFFKRIKPFAAWGIYPEMACSHWEEMFNLLKLYNASITVGVTATWAVSEKELIPFHKKFPDQASILKEGVCEGIVEIANHGLTHCILNNNLFHPHMFTSNRKYHREFWDWLPETYHKEHIERSQEILSTIFKKDIITFIHPGNVWSQQTEMYAKKFGIQYLSSIEPKAPTGKVSNGLTYVGNKAMIDFHDREIVLFGVNWLRRNLEEYSSEFCSIEQFYSKKEQKQL